MGLAEHGALTMDGSGWGAGSGMERAMGARRAASGGAGAGKSFEGAERYGLLQQLPISAQTR